MAARANHASLVSGLCAVVHFALERCRDHGVPVPDELTQALAVVDHWLSGGAVTADALGRARDTAYSAGERASKTASAIGASSEWQTRGGERLLLMRASSLSTAVGNLCHKALKTREWQTLASVMDPVSHSLPEEKPAVFEVIRMRGEASPGAPLKPAQVKRRKVDVDALAVHLGGLLAARLRKLAVHRDTTPDLAGLGALLAEKEYAESAAVATFEERYGGLDVVEDDDVWLIGAAACCLSTAHTHPSGRLNALVPVVYSPNDIIWFLDGDGGVWVQDVIEDPQPVRWADNADRMMAKLVARWCMPAGRCRVLAGKHGATIAQTNALGRIDEASDTYSSLWSDGRRWVNEDAGTTIVCGFSAAATAKF